jgi:hypothetical protein
MGSLNVMRQFLKRPCCRIAAAGEVVMKIPTCAMVCMEFGCFNEVADMLRSDPLIKSVPTLGLALLLASEKMKVKRFRSENHPRRD